jgi:hypothetical protein
VCSSDLGEEFTVIDTGGYVSGSEDIFEEAIRRQGLLNEDGDLATPFRRLKLVMDYWCALWFWPITRSSDLPSREQWWMEIGAILEGNVVELEQQRGLNLLPTEPEAPQVLVPEVQPSFEGFETQLPLSQPTGGANPANLHDKLGQLRISKLRQHFPRVAVVEGIAEQRRFMHWELFFADGRSIPGFVARKMKILPTHTEPHSVLNAIADALYDGLCVVVVSGPFFGCEYFSKPIRSQPHILHKSFVNHLEKCSVLLG